MAPDNVVANNDELYTIYVWHNDQQYGAGIDDGDLENTIQRFNACCHTTDIRYATAYDIENACSASYYTAALIRCNEQQLMSCIIYLHLIGINAIQTFE
jgi:hypothetical protein